MAGPASRERHRRASLGVLLVRQPATGLFVFWSLLVPLLPLAFLIAPGLWRSLCLMAAANQLPRFAGLMREPSLLRQPASQGRSHERPRASHRQDSS